ncbi:MAG: hypothetical protein BWY70_01940 [Bacteroidetes bacterium ADurb.Bin408]|nr:MAG: hypothetical protein BWY70_01940 [Bacteroidetes bacterium ADurb.Bin408]
MYLLVFAHVRIKYSNKNRVFPQKTGKKTTIYGKKGVFWPYHTQHICFFIKFIIDTKTNLQYIVHKDAREINILTF